MAKRLSKIKKIHQDIHVKTYNDRNGKTQQKPMGVDASKVDQYNVTNETFVIGKGATIWFWMEGAGPEGYLKKNPGASFFFQTK